MKRGSERSSGVQISWRTTNDVTDGTREIAKYPIGAIVKIGRDVDNDVVLPNPKVSRKHARLVIGTSEIEFTDLRTSNGSLIDGRRRLGSTSWRPGQILQIGDHLFEFQLLFGAGDATAPVTIPARGSVPEAYPRSLEANHPNLTPSAREPTEKVPPLPEVSKATDLHSPDGVTAKAGQRPLVEASEAVAECPVVKPADHSEPGLAPTEQQDEGHPTGHPHPRRRTRFVDRLAEGTEAAEQFPPDDATTEVEMAKEPAPPFRPDLVSGMARVPSALAEPYVAPGIQPSGRDHASEPAGITDPVERVAAPASAPGGATDAQPVGTGQLPRLARDDGLVAAFEGDQEAKKVNDPHRAESQRPWRRRLMVGSIAVALIVSLGGGIYWWTVFAQFRDGSSLPKEEIARPASQQELQPAKFPPPKEEQAQAILPSVFETVDAAATPTQEPQLRIDPGMHTAEIYRIGVDRGCTMMATGSTDKTIRLWRLPEGKLIRTLRLPIGPDQNGRVYAVAMAPDGKWVAGGGWTYFDGKRRHEHFVYVFQAANGEVIARLGPFAQTINNLAVSVDGQHLAASHSDGRVRVWKATGAHGASWQLIAEVKDYGRNRSLSAAFDPAGALYTVTHDGRLRRYEPGYTSSPTSIALRSGKQPHSIAIHPSGDRLAVGFTDVAEVDVYDAATLSWRYSANRAGTGNGSLAAVAWSTDGTELYAGGHYQRDGQRFIQVWDQAGEGSVRELEGPLNTIQHMLPCGDDMAIGAHDPAFGLLSRNGGLRSVHENVLVDMRGQVGEHFKVSQDGTRIRFGLQPGGHQPVLLDLTRERLSDSPLAPQDLYAADTQSMRFSDRSRPKLDDIPLTFRQGEIARAVAIAADKRFVLGADWTLRAYGGPKSVRAWHGIRYTYVKDEEALALGFDEAHGARITNVATPSPAQEAGLMKGDVILSINDQKVISGEDANRQLVRYPPDAKVDIKIRRALEERTISVKIGAFIPAVWQKPAPSAAWGVNITRDSRLVVVAYGDGTIRWHRLADGQELLAFFVHAKDRRWVAWTPKGYYAASSGGEGLIGWHVNRGWSEAADFFPANRFRNRFYRPDIVQQVLLTMDEDKAIAEADRRANTAQQERDILKLLPPVLEIVSHKDGDRFSNPEVIIQYSARSPTGDKVNDVDVYLDDYKVSSRGFIPVATSDKEAKSLALVLPRRNVKVTLVARSGDKASEPRSVQLTWTGATIETKLQPRLLALLIGVSAYSQQSLKLDFAHQDAIHLSEALKSQEGKAFLKVETNVLINADSATIRRGFDWLNKNARDGDLTLILLSGHGTTRSNTFYFLPAEADPASLSATAISGHEIVGTIQGLPGGKLLLIDACRAGGGLTPVGMTQVPVDMNKLANDMGQPVGAIFFGSSGVGELSYEDSKLKAGVFTAAMVEGLFGPADFNGDGKIETDEMLVWLRKRVPELTENRQHPLRHQSAPVEYTMSTR